MVAFVRTAGGLPVELLTGTRVEERVSRAEIRLQEDVVVRMGCRMRSRKREKEEE